MVRNANESNIPSDWKYDFLDKFATRGSGHTPNKENASYWNGGIKWVSLTDSPLLDKGLIFKTDKEISDEGLNNSSAVIHPAGTVILTRDAGVGKSAVLAYPMAVSQHFMAWLCDNKKLNNWFLYYWLQLMKPEFERQAVGSTIKTIGLPYFKKLRIAIPNHAEQEKISEILFTWDQAILAIEKIIANSMKQKAAIMQRLLNESPEKPNWKEYSLSSLVQEIKRPVIWSDNSEYKLLSVKRRSEGVVLREKLLGRQILTKKMNTVHSGDFLISKMQVLHGAMGLVRNEHHEHHVSDSYICLNSISPEKLDMEFFSWYCKKKSMYHKAFLCSYGVHIEKMTFNFELFLKEKIKIPPINEQTLIVTILNTVEHEIEISKKKLSLLRQEKKSLMRQLLTGKRRINVKAIE